MESLPDPNAGEDKKEKSGKDPEGRMTFTEHLGELRTRLVRSGIAIVIGFVVCYWQADNIIPLLMKPLTDRGMSDRLKIGMSERFTMISELIGDSFWSTGDEEGDEDSSENETAEEPDGADADAEPEEEKEPVVVVLLNPLEVVLVYLKISAFGGILLALPVLLFEICGFIFPGLTRKERTLVRILMIGCASLSVAGVAIAYFIIFPLVMPYLMDFAPEGTVQQLRMNETTSLLLKGLAGFGIAFQFPMAVLILVYMGMITPALLRQHRRVAIVGMLVLSMLLTPPDPFSMILMAGPLILLYEGSIWVSYLVLIGRRKKEPTDNDLEPTAK